MNYLETLGNLESKGKEFKIDLITIDAKLKSTFYLKSFIFPFTMYLFNLIN